MDEVECLGEDAHLKGDSSLREGLNFDENSSLREDVGSWQCEIEIQVRSTEIDVNGHVNNAKYLEYLEWGREAWFEQYGLDYDVLRDEGVVTVVVHVSANYRREAVQNDRLRIRSRLHSVRNTSLVMQQVILNQRSEEVIDAEFVIVTIDPQNHQTVRVPDTIRHRILLR